jgi:2-keto-4-pentenoate hydratase/2-oxohepta-3-ene-1,7-dioic acid hydratase in catechol pathway
MKIIRFCNAGGQVHLGQQGKNSTAYILEGDIFKGLQKAGKQVQVHKLLTPIEPRNILCIGLNYRGHAVESGAKIPRCPVLFIKSVNAVTNPGDPIVIPAVEPVEVDYECELAVVIGKAAKNVSRKEALDYVLGYTCANDVSGRDWQLKKGGSQWCRGKSFDTFCPLGPCIVMPDEIPDPNNLRIRTILNGQVMQDSNTSDMLFDVPDLIHFLSQGTTLQPGTVILTGTPQGVGYARKPPVFLRDGDTVVVEIESIGRLENPVRSESSV